jgi:hypothetical protein
VSESAQMERLTKSPPLWRASIFAYVKSWLQGINAGPDTEFLPYNPFVPADVSIRVFSVPAQP